MGITKSTHTLIARGTSHPASTQLAGCSVTRSGTTATLTKTSHGRSTSDKVLIQGFSLEEFNTIASITVTDANNFTYTICADPGANPSGTPGTVDLVTLGTALDLSTAYDAQIIGLLQNGTTGPTIPPQVWLGLSTSSNAYDYTWRMVAGGDSTANSMTPIVIDIPLPTKYVNIAVGKNSVAAVDFQFICYYVSGIS